MIFLCTEHVCVNQYVEQGYISFLIQQTQFNKRGQTRFMPIIKAYVPLQVDGFYTDVSSINFHIYTTCKYENMINLE